MFSFKNVFCKPIHNIQIKVIFLAGFEILIFLAKEKFIVIAHYTLTCGFS